MLRALSVRRKEFQKIDLNARSNVLKTEDKKGALSSDRIMQRVLRFSGVTTLYDLHVELEELNVSLD